MNNNPSSLRRHYRQLRLQIPPAQQAAHAQALKTRIEHLLRFSRPRKIAGYLACAGEISLDPWLENPGRHQPHLPMLYEAIAPRLRFGPIDSTTGWKLNRYGIIEPDLHWGETRDAREMDVVLMPLVAFDRYGHRLGMGGGFYDRSLAFRRARRHWHRPLLVGVAHSLQEHPELPHQPWDVPLDLVMTERELIRPLAAY